MSISFRKVLLGCLLLGGTAYGIAALRSPHSLVAFGEKRREIERLERENELLQRKNAAKQNYLTRLQQNPDELKLEIERRLKLVSPGTKQFILQDGTSPDSPPDTEPRQ